MINDINLVIYLKEVNLDKILSKKITAETFRKQLANVNSFDQLHCIF